MMENNYYFTNVSSKSPSFVKSDGHRLPVNEKIFNTPDNARQLEYVNGKDGTWSANIFREDIRGQDHFKAVEIFYFQNLSNCRYGTKGISIGTSNYGKFLWGAYGFRDAFNLTENWCSQIYMRLNQGPTVAMN